jgi:hypothetical protein
LIPQERDTFNQRRLEAIGAGQSPKQWDEKLKNLVEEGKALDERQAAIEERVRELKQISSYAHTRRKTAMNNLCAARQAGLADEINELLFALHPRLEEIKAIHRALSIYVAPIVPPGNFNTIPSVKYPESLMLERK